MYLHSFSVALPYFTSSLILLTIAHRFKAYFYAILCALHDECAVADIFKLENQERRDKPSTTDVDQIKTLAENNPNLEKYSRFVILKIKIKQNFPEIANRLFLALKLVQKQYKLSQ